MSAPEDAVVAAAVAWVNTPPPARVGDVVRELQDAVEALLASRQPRQLTWAQVPAGWSVLAPDGRWYQVTGTRCTVHAGRVSQMVTMAGIGEHPRDPQGPVTARPTWALNAVDAAIEALGYPAILEDGS